LKQNLPEETDLLKLTRSKFKVLEKEFSLNLCAVGIYKNLLIPVKDILYNEILTLVKASKNIEDQLNSIDVV